MQNIGKHISLFFVFFIITLFSIQLASAETVREYIDDASITAKVVAVLSANADIPSKDILVNTYKGNVQLCGFVDTQSQVDAAEQTVANMKGMEKMTNDLIPLDRNKETQHSGALNDTKITADVKQILFKDNQIPFNQISVVTKNGIVQLCGFVEDKKVIEKANNILKSVKDVRSVQNNLIAKS